jgi:hypothetical protein
MTWGATAIAGASLVGSVVSSQASKSAAGTQAKASKQAIAQQYEAAQASIANQQQVLDSISMVSLLCIITLSSSCLSPLVKLKG